MNTQSDQTANNQPSAGQRLKAKLTGNPPKTENQQSVTEFPNQQVQPSQHQTGFQTQQGGSTTAQNGSVAPNQQGQRNDASGGWQQAFAQDSQGRQDGHSDQTGNQVQYQQQGQGQQAGFSSGQGQNGVDHKSHHHQQRHAQGNEYPVNQGTGSNQAAGTHATNPGQWKTDASANGQQSNLGNNQGSYASNQGTAGGFSNQSDAPGNQGGTFGNHGNTDGGVGHTTRHDTATQGIGPQRQSGYNTNAYQSGPGEANQNQFVGGRTTITDKLVGAIDKGIGKVTNDPERIQQGEMRMHGMTGTAPGV